jgi:hypothetical protein
MFDDKNSEYSIDQLNERFDKLFGKDAAELFMDLLRKALDSQ